MVGAFFTRCATEGILRNQIFLRKEKKRKAPLVEQISINLERYLLKHNYKQYPSKKVKLRSKSPVKIKSVFYIFLNIISAIIS